MRYNIFNSLTFSRRYVICPTIICPTQHLSCTSFVLQGGENLNFPTHHMSYTSFFLHLICPTHPLSYTSLVLHIICPTHHFSYTSFVLQGGEIFIIIRIYLKPINLGMRQMVLGQIIAEQMTGAKRIRLF